MSDGPEFICPHCGQPVIVDSTGNEQSWNCPDCGGEFSVAADPGESAHEPDPDPKPDRADELDGLRIRQITAQRRADIRVRSYLFVAAVGCAAAAAQCLFWVWRAARWGLGRIGFALAAVALLVLAWWFATRVVTISRKLAKPLLDEPILPPDFSGLRNGSQMTDDLERLSSGP